MNADRTLADYWTAIYRRKGVVLLLTATAALVAYGISIALTSVYEAKSVFYVPYNQTPVSFTGEGFSETITQEPLLPVAEKKQASVSLGILQSRAMMERLHEQFPGIPLDRLRRTVDVVVSGEFMLEAYVRDTDPGRAAAIANQIPENFQQFHSDILRDRVAAVAEALAGELALVSSRIETLEARRDRLSVERRVASPDAEFASHARLRQDLEDRLVEAEADLDEHRQRLARIDAQLGDGELLFQETEALRLNRLQEATAIEGLEARLARLRERLGELRDREARLPEDMAELRTLEREIDRLHDREAALEQNLSETRLQVEEPPRAMVLVETAVPPTRPAFPIPALNAIVAGLVGLVVGPYYALFLDYLGRDRRRRLERDMDWSVISDFLRKDPDPEAATAVAIRWDPFEEQPMRDGYVISRQAPENGGAPSYVVYDPDGRIVDYSPNYPQRYPEVRDRIRPGVGLDDVLRAAAERGGMVPQGEVESWVQEKLRERLGPDWPRHGQTSA